VEAVFELEQPERMTKKQTKKPTANAGIERTDKNDMDSETVDNAGYRASVTILSANRST
jgi:hypothetical protein